MDTQPDNDDKCFIHWEHTRARTHTRKVEKMTLEQKKGVSKNASRKVKLDMKQPPHNFLKGLQCSGYAAR